MNYAATLSKGSQMLGAIPGTVKEIAERSGIPASTISRLRTGHMSAPSEAVAVKAELHLNIPRGAWHEHTALAEDMGAELTGRGNISAGGITVTIGAPVTEPPSTPQGHLQVCRAWRIALQGKGAAAKDITAALEAERRAVELLRKARIEDEEAVITTILEVLEGFPEAKEAVAKALEST